MNSFLNERNILPNMQDFQIYIPFEKQVSGEGRVTLFGGIAASSDLDREGDIIEPQVIEKIASELRKNTTVFFNHQTKGLGVGKVKDAYAKNGEVHIEVEPTNAKGMEDVILQIGEGILKNFSIGGKVLKCEDKYIEKYGRKVRVIKDVSCYEVSVVGVPANTEASITSYIAKSFSGAGDDMVEKSASTKEEEEKKKKEDTEKCNKSQKTEMDSAPNENIDLAVKKMLESPELKKALSDFNTEMDSKISNLEKQYASKISSLEKSNIEMQEALNSANARNDSLRKSIDDKHKALQTEQEEYQKSFKEDKKSEKITKEVAPSFFKGIY